RTYAELYARARRLASALAKRGIERGDTVSVMLANTPAMLEAHYGVPMTGAVLNTLNTRLDAAIIAFTLDHAETKILIADREFSKIVKEALGLAKVKPLVIDYDDPEFTGPGERLGSRDYEEFLAGGEEGRGLQRHASLRADRDLWAGGDQRLASCVGCTRAGRAGGQEGAAGRALCSARSARGDGSRDDAPGAARRRDHGRSDVPRQRGDEGLSQEQIGDREGIRGRLVPLRRPRGDAPRRLHPAERSFQG